MKKIETIEFGKRLKELRLECGYTLDNLCEIYNQKFGSGLNKGTLSRYENSTQEPLFTTVKNLSELFNVTIEYLVGKSNERYPGVLKFETKKIVPVVGIIAAGGPIIADQHIEGYENCDDESIDYCLRVKGDSMVGARIFDGDIVFVDKDAVIENGDVVVALVDGENATLKKYYKFGGKVILKPENPTMKEMEFNAKDKNFKLLGKVKSVKFKL